MWQSFVDLVYNVLLHLSLWTGSFGLAIILLTIVTRLAMFPLMIKQTKAAAVMRKIQPKIKKMQEKYKDKPQEMQKRMLEIYKENRANPLGGCLPMLIQFPVMIALFWVTRDFPERIAENAELVEQINLIFLGIDLSVADPWMILPILAGITTYFQMNMTMSDPSQKTMMMMFPIIMLVISRTLPAGVVLYWVVGNLFGIGQQYLTLKRERDNNNDKNDAEGGAAEG